MTGGVSSGKWRDGLRRKSPSPRSRKRSSSSLSSSICSSNSECSTTAAAPASSMRRTLPTSSHIGEDEATSGFFSFNPR